MIQGGDCAETFSDFNSTAIRNKLKILLQMSVILTYGTSCKVIKVGRIAGQFAKPRSQSIETKGDVSLPIYRGDCVNDIAFTEANRAPDPARLLRAYNQSAATLNPAQSLYDGRICRFNKSAYLEP